MEFMKIQVINKNLDTANISSTVAEIWASGPTIDIVPLLFLPTSSDPLTWSVAPNVKVSAKVGVDSKDATGASAFSFVAFFVSGAGHLPIQAFGCLYQGGCIGVITLDQPFYLSRRFFLNVRGQSQPVR
jgi:hypothetical protein